ncbi:hypothetical protein CIK05_01790 [Bdellovibrio sp. qaytius]|nr:hypothetical protein CIK05_01790 [Bdellovibrio sp. qaytius]
MINLLVTLVAVLGTQVTFYLIHEKHVSTVRASSGASLAFALVTLLIPVSFITTLQAAFLGSTFVGMTAKSRMGKKRVFCASLLFAMIFILVIPHFQGLGGGLGTAAFISSAIVHIISNMIKK